MVLIFMTPLGQGWLNKKPKLSHDYKTTKHLPAWVLGEITILPNFSKKKIYQTKYMDSEKLWKIYMLQMFNKNSIRSPIVASTIPSQI